jgi:Phosphotransferase enzyme family
VAVNHAISDRELLEALDGQLDGRTVIALRRHPYRYATSASLEEVIVVTEGGAEVALLLKDLCRQRLLDQARATKPDFLHEPRRELEAYRRILGPAGLGPRCHAAVGDPSRSRHWLLIEKVPGVELWQIEELSVWEAVAAWVGGLHARFAARLAQVREANPYLLEHSESWFRFWRKRAGAALARSTDRRARELERALGRYDEAVGALVALPRALVHGEFYPSNVLVVREDDSIRVCPVDWEMSAIGPGLIDLAALVGGWASTERGRLADAYCRGLAAAGPAGPAPETLDPGLSLCRLHLALQWLGWSSDWRPPKEHAHDWIGEALALVEDLGLR